MLPLVLALSVMAIWGDGRLVAQLQGPKNSGDSVTPAPSPVERLGPDRLRIGNIQIDSSKKELSVQGRVNSARVLEFLACTKGGFKAYESALELDTNAVNFNVALILLGLDSSQAVVAKRQFDPEPPKGSPVELFVDWDENGQTQRVRAERLLYDYVLKKPLSDGPWVYTGSTFSEDRKSYLAQRDGVLIGFMHTPAPIIESPRPLTSPYGSWGLNRELSLKAGMIVTLTVRVLPSDKER